MAVENESASGERGTRIPGSSAARPSGALPSAGGGIARLACARATAAGIALEPLLKKAKLTLQQIEDRTARVPTASQIRILDLVASSIPDGLLGFHLAGAFELREIGLLHYVLASSETLDDAMQRASRYSTLANEGVALRYVDRNDVAIMFNYVGVPRHVRPPPDRVLADRAGAELPRPDAAPPAAAPRAADPSSPR